jgi:hypothetical protein
VLNADFLYVLLTLAHEQHLPAMFVVLTFVQAAVQEPVLVVSSSFRP